jgi:acetate kinase
MSRVLVINAGSSSLKYQLLDPATGEVAAAGLVERIGEEGSTLRHTVGESVLRHSVPIPDAAEAFAQLSAAFAEAGPDLQAQPPVAVGHRVVHGGTRFSAATVIDDDVLATLEELTPLAPLHNPANVVGIRAARAAFPTLPQIAVFDTAFHRTLPPAPIRMPCPSSGARTTRCVAMASTAPRTSTSRAACNPSSARTTSRRWCCISATGAVPAPFWTARVSRPRWA